MAGKSKITECAAEAETSMAQTESAAQEAKEEYVKVFIRRPPDERNVKAKIVGVNGKMYGVPYDKEVDVPAAVAEILKASEAAEQEAYEIINALEGKVLMLGGD